MGLIAKASPFENTLLMKARKAVESRQKGERLAGRGHQGQSNSLGFSFDKSASLGSRNSLIHLPSGGSGGMAPLPLFILLCFCSDVCGLVMNGVMLPVGSPLPMVLSPTTYLALIERDWMAQVQQVRAVWLSYSYRYPYLYFFPAMGHSGFAFFLDSLFETESTSSLSPFLLLAGRTKTLYYRTSISEHRRGSLSRPEKALSINPLLSPSALEIDENATTLQLRDGKWLFKPSYLKEYHAPQGQISGKITQLHGINYDKAFSPVGKPVTIGTVLSVLSCLTGSSRREGRKRIASLVYHASIFAGMFSPQSHSFSLRHLIRDGMAYQ
ncbi:hypothetical protein U1Q18_000212 [Sarracenia purpurea var. burkii]